MRVKDWSKAARRQRSVGACEAVPLEVSVSLSPREVFLRLVNGVSEGRHHELPELYGEITDVRHPMATPEAAPLLSRSALKAHFALPPDVREETIPKRRPVDITVHETADPEVIIAEFSYEFTMPDASLVKVPCVFVLRVRDGKIIESRDYIDPIRQAQAWKRTDRLIASIRGDAD